MTKDEKEKLKKNLIKKHDYTTVWIHWFNALVWFLLLPTGAALISAEKYNFVPIGFIKWMSSLFVGRENLLKMHVWIGVFWIFIILTYAIFGAKRYFPIVKSLFIIDSDDIKWLKAFLSKILGKKVDMPPQGFFNAGQKLVAINIYLMTPIIMITGLIMAFQLLPPPIIRLSILLHFIAVGSICINLPIHIFMAAFYAPEREAFKSMITGHLSEYFLYKHNYKFWKKLKNINKSRN